MAPATFGRAEGNLLDQWRGHVGQRSEICGNHGWHLSCFRDLIWVPACDLSRHSPSNERGIQVFYFLGKSPQCGPPPIHCLYLQSCELVQGGMEFAPP